MYMKVARMVNAVFYHMHTRKATRDEVLRFLSVLHRVWQGQKVAHAALALHLGPYSPTFSKWDLILTVVHQSTL